MWKARRLLYSFFLLAHSTVLAQQTEHIQLKKMLVPLPSVSGVQDGEIPYYLLCSPEGLHCSDTIKVTSFKIHYVHQDSDVELSIAGNRIPDSVCAQIGYDGIGIPVFITCIFGKSDSGREYALWSMNLTPVRDED